MLQYLFRTILIFLILLQVFLTYHGFRLLNDQSWFRVSYEEKAAALSKKYLPNGNVILLASEPEPYFYTLQIPTQSIADTYPYLFMIDVPKNQPLLIIEDMGMHAYFPRFTKFLQENMQDKKKAHFWVKEKYHIVDRSEKETHPVVLYETTLEELQRSIKNSE